MPNPKKIILSLACLIAGALLMAQTAPSSHRFLKCGAASESVAIVGTNGEIEWEYPIRDETSDAWLLDNGNVIFSFKKGVREVKPDKSLAWEYLAPAGAENHSCQPLAEGLFLVGESYSNGTSALFEMQRGGQVRKTVTISNGGNAHGQFRQVRKTPQGTYLVCFQRGGGKAQEYDGAGKLLRTFPGGRFVAVRLPDGNTLIACGDEHRLIEVDPAGTVVWELTQNGVEGLSLGFVAGVQRLPNGNTVFCNWSGHGGAKDQPQLVELTRDKKIVWSVRDPRLKLISCVNILDPGAGSLR